MGAVGEDAEDAKPQELESGCHRPGAATQLLKTSRMLTLALPGDHTQGSCLAQGLGCNCVDATCPCAFYFTLQTEFCGVNCSASPVPPIRVPQTQGTHASTMAAAWVMSSSQTCFHTLGYVQLTDVLSHTDIRT